MTQAVAAAKVDPQTQTRRAVTHLHRSVTLQSRLERKLLVVRKAKGTVQFFREHRWLLRSKEHGVVARKTLARATARLARTRREIAWLRRAIRVRTMRRLAAASPEEAICGVFRGYCRQAVDVAWCESRLHPDARNGQYLGLFQMGTLARELFGHGETAQAQAIAAHKYFVSSGKDWSPWSCKPSGGY